MFGDGLTFGSRELFRQNIVGQQCEHRPLVGDFRTETIHHTDFLILVCLYQRVIQREAQQKLLHTDAAVDQVNIKIAGPQNTVLVLQLFR